MKWTRVKCIHQLWNTNKKSVSSPFIICHIKSCSVLNTLIFWNNYPLSITIGIHADCFQKNTFCNLNSSSPFNFSMPIPCALKPWNYWNWSPRAKPSRNRPLSSFRRVICLVDGVFNPGLGSLETTSTISSSSVEFLVSMRLTIGEGNKFLRKFQLSASSNKGYYSRIPMPLWRKIWQTVSPCSFNFYLF